MIRLHHVPGSRSFRVLWLIEEIGPERFGGLEVIEHRIDVDLDRVLEVRESAFGHVAKVEARVHDLVVAEEDVHPAAGGLRLVLQTHGQVHHRPVVGAAIVVLLPEFLADMAEYRLLLFGALLLGVLWAAPRGVALRAVRAAVRPRRAAPAPGAIPRSRSARGSWC